MASRTTLTKQERDFAEYYLSMERPNLGTAYKLAFPHSKKWTEKSISNRASQLWKTTEIQEYALIIQEKAKEKAIEILCKRYEVTEDKIIQESAAMAFLNVGDFYEIIDGELTLKKDLKADQLRGLAGIKQRVTHFKGGESIATEFKFDKLGALKTLAEYKKLLTQQHQIDITPELRTVLGLINGSTKGKLPAEDGKDSSKAS